jgi:ribosome maturation factor RimP
MQLDTSIVELLRDLAEGEGLELVATEVVGSGPQTVLRLVIDGPDGVNLDQCAEVSRMASALLDVEDPLTHGYTLEVSSPGLDRKLFERGDYERFADRRISIRMAPSFRTRRRVSGVLLGLQDEWVRVREDSGEVVELPFSEVFEARLEIDWKQILKEGKSRR